MAEDQTNTIVRLHPATRRKLDEIRREKPAHSLQGLMADAVDLLAEKLGVKCAGDGVHREREREPAPAA